MRSPESGGSFYEGLTAIEEIDRLELSLDLSRRLEEAANKDIEASINQDPLLHSMISKLVESGPELPSATRSHVRRMIALRLWPLKDIHDLAVLDTAFSGIALAEVQSELNELAGFEDQLQDLPDMWDIALEDLLRLDDED